jgi:hypothetical protein
MTELKTVKGYSQRGKQCIGFGDNTVGLRKKSRYSFGQKLRSLLLSLKIIKPMGRSGAIFLSIFLHRRALPLSYMPGHHYS